ncbi:MAG: tRNA (N6-threonylcarbamoyladenosine(37)-N6)-methyltransferase TrmO [Bacteroidales bacterium]|nr:tRNA (N6-threonylcarbamoyladenosine(37)-N6)-methyltransferase TrmO [Bacteroidales bacterium]
MEIKPIATYRGPFGSKFGIPRQSSLANTEGRIVFLKEYSVKEALRGLEGFDHIWLIWEFNANKEAKGEWQPTVRPPRLGGNTAMGVFATRSPYRPNPLGLSCVELTAIENGELVVKGADLMDGTPIFDIKPYLPYADSFPEAKAGFAQEAPETKLKVVVPSDIAIGPEVKGILSLDPRPAYQDAPGKVYGMLYAGRDIKFKVEGDTLTVLSAEKA